MINEYKGHYSYNEETISDWNSTAIGVYYCGYKNSTNNELIILYIGKGTGDDGIRGRLLDHLREDNWPDVTHFGYHTADDTEEAENFEAKEIEQYKPKYNKQGK